MKKSTKNTYIILRILMAIVFVLSTMGLFLSPDDSVQSDYMFNIAQSGLFLIFSFSPFFLRKLNLDIPDVVYIIFVFFLMAHFFCGEILGFFVTISWWDSVLHTFTGMLIALLSFSVVNILNKTNGSGFKLNIWFTALFAFCLTLTIGVLWEILEFASDMLFGTNMQRTFISSLSGRGEPLVGSKAVIDTMKDLILDAIGALVVCIICAICVIKNKVKVEQLSFIKVNNQNAKLKEKYLQEIKKVEEDKIIDIKDFEEDNIVLNKKE